MTLDLGATRHRDFQRDVAGRVLNKKPKKLSKKQAKKFLATTQGQLWLERKMAKRLAARPDPGPPPERFTRTRFPFAATINGKEVWVSRNAYGIQVDYE